VKKISTLVRPGLLQKPGGPKFCSPDLQSQSGYFDSLWGAISAALQLFCFQGDYTGCEKKAEKCHLAADCSTEEFSGILLSPGILFDLPTLRDRRSREAVQKCHTTR
jgi:hypothetical protein